MFWSIPYFLTIDNLIDNIVDNVCSKMINKLIFNRKWIERDFCVRDCGIRSNVDSDGVVVWDECIYVDDVMIKTNNVVALITKI